MTSNGKVGKPTLYNEDIAGEICARLAEGESLNSVCKDEHMPAESTVRSWAINPDHPISANYTRAREIGYMKMADELLEISDDGSNDWMERNRGDDKAWVENGEAISRSRLRVDTRKWLLSKALPKVFGDKLLHAGPDGGAIEHKHDIAYIIIDPAAPGSPDPA